MPGIFEYQFMGGKAGEREKRIARLIHAYKAAYNAAKGDAKITFPLTRVIPVDRKIPVKNAVHTYDQVASYIGKYDSISVGSCYCRHAARLRGEDVHDMPVEVCMWFGKAGEFAADRLGGRRVSKQEAMGILAAAEEAGLVHMSRNTTDEIEFLCNCDRWHCEVVKGVLKQPKPGLVFNSGFQPHFDPERCIACETCIGRCPSGALRMGLGSGARGGPGPLFRMRRVCDRLRAGSHCHGGQTRLPGASQNHEGPDCRPEGERRATIRLAFPRLRWTSDSAVGAVAGHMTAWLPGLKFTAIDRST